MICTAIRSARRRQASSRLVHAPTILCIDDDPNILECFRRRFRRRGIQVLGATTGQFGYSLAVERRPELIITDLRMPDGSGRWLLSRLKANKRTRDIPVIMLTGAGGPEFEGLAALLGVERYLLKPLPFQQLLEEIRPYLPEVDAA